MVDINLLGDEKPLEENDSGDNFDNNYQDNANQDLSPEQDYTDTELDDTLYGAYTQSSSKKAVFIVSGIIVVAAIAVGTWYFLNSRKGQTPITNQEIVQETPQQQSEIPQQQQTTPASTQITEQPAAAQQTTPEPPPVQETIPPYISSIVVANQQGVRTIESILATIPQNVKVTMIQYRDGNFLTEVHGSPSTNFTALNTRIQQNLAGGSVQVLSQENRQLQGRQYQQALLKGNVSGSAGGRVSAPNFMEVGQIRSTFRNNCSQAGLTLKEFDVKRDVSTSQFVKTPIIFKAVGTKDAALNFLNSVISQNININLSKIVFTTPISELSGQKMNLILNLEVYQPTL